MQAVSLFIGFMLGFFLAFFMYIGNRFKKNQLMYAYYPDGSWFTGIRKWNYPARETPGTHHFMVTDGSDAFKPFINKRIAVPIASVKFFAITEAR